MGYYLNADGSTPASRLPPGYTNPSDNAGSRAALDRLTLQACTNAKNAGISIYTIAFSASSDPIDANGIDLMANCASSSDKAFVANASTGLVDAFSKIAPSLGAFRLSQ